MKSNALSALPLSVTRAIRKLGGDIKVARIKRRLTMAIVAERAGGISMSTYQRVEQGDPAVSMAVYASVLFALGLLDRLTDLVDVARDDTGLLLDRERLPKRVSSRRGGGL